MAIGMSGRAGMHCGTIQDHSPDGPSVPFMHLADEALDILIDPPNGKIRGLPFPVQGSYFIGRPQLSCERCAEKQDAKLRQCKGCNLIICFDCTGTHYHKKTFCLDCEEA